MFVSLDCPWCHRVTLALNVLGLQDSITMDVAFPSRTGEDDPVAPNLWEFSPDRIATLTGVASSNALDHCRQGCFGRSWNNVIPLGPIKPMSYRQAYSHPELAT